MNLDHEIFGDPEPIFADSPRYVRVKAALPLIGVSRSTLYKLIGAGSIRAIKVGGATMIDLRSVAALFDRSPEIAPRKHQRVITAEALGLDAGLAGLGSINLGSLTEPVAVPVGESPSIPGSSAGVATADAQADALRGRTAP